MAALNFKAMACWSNSIADLGFWIAEFNSDFDLILIISIRNPLTPLLHVRDPSPGCCIYHKYP